MKFEELVTSLEMSKRLKEADIEMETPFGWYGKHGEIVLDTYDSFHFDAVFGGGLGSCRLLYPAYTFQQIWTVLPRFLDRDKYCKDLDFSGGVNYEGDDCHVYMPHGDGVVYYLEEDGNICNAAGKTLLWCLEQGHITLEDVNNGTK